MRNVVSAVLILFVGLSGCDKKPTAPRTEAATGSSSATVTIEIAEPAQVFADKAAANIMFEIRVSKLAARRAGTDNVKLFAKRMVSVQSDSAFRLKRAAQTASPAIIPVAALSVNQQRTVTRLGILSGADFDRAYAKIQVETLGQMVDMLRIYQEDGAEPSLKAFAVAIAPSARAHLAEAKGL